MIGLAAVQKRQLRQRILTPGASPFRKELQRCKAAGMTPSQAADDPAVREAGVSFGPLLVVLIGAGMLAEAITAIWDLVDKVKGD